MRKVETTVAYVKIELNGSANAENSPRSVFPIVKDFHFSLCFILFFYGIHRNLDKAQFDARKSYKYLWDALLFLRRFNWNLAKEFPSSFFLLFPGREIIMCEIGLTSYNSYSCNRKID